MKTKKKQNKYGTEYEVKMIWMWFDDKLIYENCCIRRSVHSNLITRLFCVICVAFNHKFG